MELEFNLDGRKAIVKEISRNGNILTVSVDDDIYEIDFLKVGKRKYSVIYRGKSYNIDVIESTDPKHYTVHTSYNSYNIEVLDAEAKYLHSREDAGSGHAGNIIRSPMPGKVVKILVNKGDSVEAGQTVIIVSAMKMESEFKAAAKGIVADIKVKEGDTVDGNQVLIIVE
jgi:biotin carboxyl carrier protein